jgi:type I restriction enzyme, S subunit
LRDGTRGTGQPNVNGQTLGMLILPLPPLAEQYRIVAKVDELMALCDRLEAARAGREAVRDRLAAASLARLNAPHPATFQDDARFALDALTVLTTRPDQIKQLRQTILNLAVRGKLVPQDAKDEPASELLKRIAGEKARLVKVGEIRKEKRLPPIQDDAIPFELPFGWAWARLGHLSKLVTSGSRDWAEYYAEEGAIFVRMGNSRGSYNVRLNSVQRVKPPRDTEGDRTRLEAGDVLISITGEVGLLGLIPQDFGEAYINQHTCVVRLMAELQSRFIPELFRSPFAQDQFNAPQRGIKNSFRLTDVTEFLVPLPPLAEQHRIVAKIDALMALCDQLEASLDHTAATRRRLLDVLLAEALAPGKERELEAAE